VEDATLNTPSHIHNPSPRHPFSVMSRSNRVALQTEGLSLADSPHLSSNRMHPGERLWRPFRPNARIPPRDLNWPHSLPPPFAGCSNATP
jgi:hypothetical protein